MRFWATMRRPFSSNRALILPVRFRRVASGLMIEKVRSTAMNPSIDEWARLINAGFAGRKAANRLGFGPMSVLNAAPHVAHHRPQLPPRRARAFRARLDGDQRRLEGRPGRPQRRRQVDA